MRVLLIEDSAALQLSLSRSLVRQGMQVESFRDGLTALARWKQAGVPAPDIVLLDLSLPDCDGLELLSQARAAGLRTPVLILTARGTVGDRILGLNGGADDYLPKPFDLDELLARMRVLLRRGGAPAPEPARSFCGLRIEPDSEAVYHLGLPLDMPPRETALLRALLARPGHAQAKERLFEQVFADQPDAHLEAVEVVAYRLRKHLSGVGVQLVTLRGLGYLLKAAE